MPILAEPQKCCGCASCANICAKSAIAMLPNEEGFLHPSVDTKACAECGACVKVCPSLRFEIANHHIHTHTHTQLPRAFILQHNDDLIRYQSTSGGAFTAVAEYVIRNNGVVFGAVFSDDLKVKHTCVETIEELARFRNSKYVQSEIGDSYKQTKTFLNEGRQVCFSGTPCQISGLMSFLGKEYKNLFTIDLVCKSVPSPLVFEKYIEFKRNKEKNITDVVFRDKKRGFLYCTMAHYASHDARAKGHSIYRRGSESDEWLRLFLSGQISRHSCVTCPYQATNHEADITLGDVWETGNSQFDDNKGTTKVIVRTDKGLRLLEGIKQSVRCEEISVNLSSGKVPTERFNIGPNRKELFHDVNYLPVNAFFNKYVPYNTTIKAKNIGRYLLWKIGLQSFIRHIKHSCIHRGHHGAN